MSNKKDMGALNKKAASDQNKQIIMILCAIVVVIIIVCLGLKGIKNEESSKINVSKMVENAETKIIYIGTKDKKKCKYCSDVKKYLDKENIKYVSYDVSDYSKSEYEEMLRTIEINPDDFGYPGVVYIKDGRLYANVINLDDIKLLDEFIKTYELKKIK